jgi:LPS-assembly protein
VVVVKNPSLTMLASHKRNYPKLPRLLRQSASACYGFRLNLSPAPPLPPVSVSTRKCEVCLEHFLRNLFFLFATALCAFPPAASAQAPNKPAKADLPPESEIWMSALTQDSNGEWRYLTGSAKVETSEMIISGDKIDYNSDTHWAYARGHVHLEHFSTGDKLEADHGEYNLETEEGKFYEVRGTSPSKMLSSPFVLTTTNPFYFEAAWAERIKNRYILHKGFVTDCKMPKPWWTFQSPLFDIIPGDRAIARSTVFRLKRVPLLYLPYFFRPLGRNPRQSGFLTPNFGHSSLFGYIYGLGYYWAMGRSYDMTAVVQDFTLRGPAFLYDFRGKPNGVTDFNFNLYSVHDKGVLVGNTLEREGGTEFELTARTRIKGFDGRLDYNYLSSYLFREVFSYSFATAVSNDVASIGYLQRHFHDDAYTLAIAMKRDQEFQGITFQGQAPNQVIIQKLPSIEFSGRDQQIISGPLPLWFSFESSAGALTRDESTSIATGPRPNQMLETGVVGRVDVEPRVATSFSFAGFSLAPSITMGATEYTNSYATHSSSVNGSVSCGGFSTCSATNATLANSDLFRKDADLLLDFRPPALERVFAPPKWLHLGEKVKHVIEAEATYEYVTGISDFRRTILFDETDILSNTNQLTVSLTNRLYRKDKAGNVSEFVTWRVAQARYFDPTFGASVQPGIRNVVLATEELTPFAFLDGPRNYSPVVSSLSLSPYSFLSIEWRAEYDPLRKKLVASSYGTSVRHGKYAASVGDTTTNTDPVLVPHANQITFSAGYGSSNGKGWNAASTFDYDLIQGRRLYDFLQLSYNTNCCGFSFQVRQFNLGIRNDNQYLFSFSIANVGTFGSLQKQARIF